MATQPLRDKRRFSDSSQYRAGVYYEGDGKPVGLVYGDSEEHSPLSPSCARVLENHLFALTKSALTTQAWRGTKLMVP